MNSKSYRIFWMSFLIVNICGITSHVIECEFEEITEYDQQIKLGYGCVVSSIEINFDSIIKFSGTHFPGKSNHNVEVLFFGTSPVNLRHFDSSFCENYPNLKIIVFRQLTIGVLNENAISSCQNLRELRAQGANIREIAENFFALNSRLLKVDLSGNELVTLPERLFQHQSYLNILNLAGNKINFLPSNIFDQLSELRVLRLDKNFLGTLDPSWFANIQNLGELRLGHNEISDLPQEIFSRLPNLRTLWLDGNKLTIIHGDSFGVHKQLAHANFYNNKITAIDEKLINNSAFSHLSMGGNVCYDREATGAEIRSSLKQCFANYKPRQPKVPINYRHNPFLGTTRGSTTTAQPVIGRRSKIKASASGVQACGVPIKGKGNIIGGREIAPNAYPWIAALIYQAGPYFCGATLVSEKKVVTAAHCILETSYSEPLLPRDVKVLLGVHNLKETFAAGLRVAVVHRIHIHPDWNPSTTTFDADIAALVLDQKVIFDDYIQPICLPDPLSETTQIRSAFVAGYGKSENESKKHEEIPRLLEMPIHFNNDCFFDHPALLSISSRRTFCAGTGRGVGVCKGDSGSGLVVNNGGVYYLRGIVSSSVIGGRYGCDVDQYAVFTDILHYLDWIKGIEIGDKWY